MQFISKCKYCDSVIMLPKVYNSCPNCGAPIENITAIEENKFNRENTIEIAVATPKADNERRFSDQVKEETVSFGIMFIFLILLISTGIIIFNMAKGISRSALGVDKSAIEESVEVTETQYDSLIVDEEG